MEKPDKISELLDECLNENLILIVISHVRDKKSELKKIKIRPVLIKETVLFQATILIYGTERQ